MATSPPVCLLIARDDTLDRRASPASRDSAARRQRRSECGDAVLRFVLARATGTTSDAWSIGRTARGAPAVTGAPPRAGRMRLSLSHSGPFIVAAASAQGPVAVDLEVMRERRFADIARYLDWPAQTWANGLPDEAFFHLWTLWEASVKLASDGRQPSAREIFAEIASGIAAGRPMAVQAGTRIARSWRCPDRAWLSLIAEAQAGMRLFRLRSPPTDTRHAEIDELDADRGSLELQ